MGRTTPGLVALVNGELGRRVQVGNMPVVRKGRDIVNTLAVRAALVVRQWRAAQLDLRVVRVEQLPVDRVAVPCQDVVGKLSVARIALVPLVVPRGRSVRKVGLAVGKLAPAVWSTV